MKLAILLLVSTFSFAALAENIVVSAELVKFESMLACKDGGTRIRKVYHTTNFGPTQEGQSFTIMAPSAYDEGAIENEMTDNIYFGSSSFHDILGVQTLRDKDQKIIGANIYLSFCQFSPLIVEGRQLSNFQTPTGIILTKSISTCTNGDAITLTATLVAAQFENYPSTAVQTSFAPNEVLRTCNGNNDIAVTDGARPSGEESPSVDPIMNANHDSATSR
ncbi:MAG: hypothetical protein HYV97_17415 [Bdellovibrio sp.]|nr:hypothetical protein [Bdellovibrio sp.]